MCRASRIKSAATEAVVWVSDEKADDIRATKWLSTFRSRPSALPAPPPHSGRALRPERLLLPGPKVAAILSVVESCRRLKLLLRDYVAAVLPGLADLPITCLPDLSPAVWIAEHSQTQTTGSLEGEPSLGPARSPYATESCTSAAVGKVK
jgi:hypothetical protein